MNRKKTRLSLLAIPGGLAAFASVNCALATESVTAPAADSARRPNILVIVADDLGYGELGCQGNKQIPTPNIDSIAKNGIRFTDGYVTCPVCSPSRAGLLTGRYQQHFGFEFLLGTASEAGPYGLPLDEKTLADRLKAAGYATGAFGKWHLGYKPAFHPQKRGFGDFVGFLGGAHDYLSAKGSAKCDKNNPILRGTTKVKSIPYTTDMFGAEAASFIQKNSDKPWFVYLPFNAVHKPLQAPRKYMERVASIKDRPRGRKTYAAMELAMDDAVGVVLSKIRELKLEESTLIFFISDNGGPTGSTTSSNLPLSGGKTEVLEGGIRVPFMVQWKNTLPAGRVEHRPVIALDILPTALAASGIATDGATIDGVNLLPFLTGKDAGTPHQVLCWRYGAKYAVRMGDWKITNNKDGEKLYNLSKDIGEKHDLRKDNPDKFKELKDAYDTWNKLNIPAKWGNKGSPPNSKGEVDEDTNGEASASPAPAEQQLAFRLEDDP